MAYATATSILQVLPGLPQTSSSVNYSVTVSIIDSHIARADSLINGKIASRYDISAFMTVGAVPPTLKMLSEDISSYYAYRSFYSGDNQNDNQYLDRFKIAFDTLNEIRNGDLDLFNITGSLIDEKSTVSSTGSAVLTSTDYTASFGEDSELDWKVDQNKLDDLSDDRT